MPSTSPADYELDPAIAAQVRFNADGLVPVVVQDAEDGAVLMMAWMDAHAMAYTLASRRGTYYSRSRQEYWIKGLTSGHVQQVVSLAADCDGDTLLMRVYQTGAACHTGTRTCFDGREFSFGCEREDRQGDQQ
ncbi:phosphoribosyl-AMP cyclohydrolase [Corynebacterium ciconiae DSM 44920]|uniref:phosphoribosyl-AMP cyclohydrolase n=1 Tax=Corynebacterium ciconiae TaxID=227319 RepID=UPI000365C4EB|nr:phosphoribosyl-AMP cyclohydrolase [Corynebacterium ciconiae]WKD60830.1 phosphoribosyl-AMP cyclohydrolase [Corynebacterium ciconiae DSM 44920]